MDLLATTRGYSNWRDLATELLGGGIVQMMSYQLAQDFAEGKLTPALDKYAPHPLPVHAVYTGGRLLPAKVRALLDGWVPKLREVLGKIAPK